MARVRYDDSAHVARREYMRRWSRANKEKVRQWAMRYRWENIEDVRAFDRSRGPRPASPEMQARMQTTKRATSAVAHAIRTGRLIRPAVCEHCDQPGRIEAAHADYTKPLEIRWLCQPCHRYWDRMDPKTKS